ncbi:serine protease inhibitor, putative [Ixodes scapularis]|uniref:Serine protease inhibitor, putative n=1 Tax=Ixodes scapularis TaxID=6945 RepID=B7Q9D4_IXOSC|nr:serine protease inhibitor, putative [Ixodes scapularis]|eukprot:XP_002405775.1 serine protease inhibitor, putative [Ixodes scapularis]
MCALVPDAGTCRKKKKRFYFNATARGCLRFVYSGCGGNDNKFISMSQCQERCIRRKWFDPISVLARLNRSICALFSNQVRPEPTPRFDRAHRAQSEVYWHDLFVRVVQESQNSQNVFSVQSLLYKYKNAKFKNCSLPL